MHASFILESQSVVPSTWISVQITNSGNTNNLPLHLSLSAPPVQWDSLQTSAVPSLIPYLLWVQHMEGAGVGESRMHSNCLPVSLLAHEAVVLFCPGADLAAYP